MALEEGGCTVCAEAATADDAVAAALRERPDVCLIDVRMPGNGIRAVAEIAAGLPGTPIVMLTVSSEAEDLVNAVTAGAAGYLLKDMDPRRLPSAVRAAIAGESPIPGLLTARLIEEFRRRARSTLAIGGGRRVELTHREWDVLELLADGASTAAMAQRLSIDRVTVRRHISDLLRKLEVVSRDAAARLFRMAPTAAPSRTDPSSDD
jgi:DNA-binding NarL/FixJ family response regulator